MQLRGCADESIDDAHGQDEASGRKVQDVRALLPNDGLL